MRVVRCLVASLAMLAAKGLALRWAHAPYEDVSSGFTGEQVLAWARRRVDGQDCRISPALKSPDGYEINHHRVIIDFTGAGTVKLSVGHSASDKLDEVLKKKRRRSRLLAVKSGRETLVSSRDNRERCAWLILHTRGNVKITHIRYAHWRGRGTIYGHVPRYFRFAGAKLPYRLLYPRNYDPRRAYPLVLSVSGSGGVGTDNARNMERVILAGPLFTRYYEDKQLACFSIVPQIPPGTAIPRPYWPKGDKGRPTPIYHPGTTAVNENGWYAQATLALIKHLIDDRAINVDPNRVYFTGFSYGGKACWEFLKAGRGVFAAAISGAGWPIGRPYSNPRGLLLDRLKLEVRRYKHVPLHVIAGAKDAMRFGSRAVHKEIVAQGGKSTYVEIPKVGHIGSAAGAWGNRRHIEWLFGQNRAKNPKPGTDPFPGGDYKRDRSSTAPARKPPKKGKSPLGGFERPGAPR